MRAVYEGRDAVVQALLERPGVALNVKNDQGVTALHLAAGNGDVALTRLLLLAGADASMGDGQGRTAENLAVAAGHAKVAKLLKLP